MPSLRAEMAKLESRDPRVRRIAVRKLYEIGDSDCLRAFAPLLQDDDIWFRERARRAFEMWCGPTNAHLVVENLNLVDTDSLLLFAKLLPRLGPASGDIASKLADSEQIPVRCAAREYQLEYGDLQTREHAAEETLGDNDQRVRRVLARCIGTQHIDPLIIESLLTDPHPRVVSTCLKSLYSSEIGEQYRATISKLIDSSDSEIRCNSRLIEIKVALSNAQYNLIARLLPDEEVGVERALVSLVSNYDWTSWPEFIAHLESEDGWRVLSLLSVTASDEKARELQISLAGNHLVPISARLRIIDRLMGRASSLDVKGLVESLSSEGDPRLKQAGEQLSKVSKV